jgi:hypothetical protein
VLLSVVRGNQLSVLNQQVLRLVVTNRHVYTLWRPTSGHERVPVGGQFDTAVGVPCFPRR